MSDKKPHSRAERRLIRALTDACEAAKPTLPGFCWLTHLVDDRHFPESLRVVWVFDTQDDLAAALEGDGHRHMLDLTANALCEAGLEVTDIAARVDADSEEACRRAHGGDWQRRLATLGRH